MKVSKDKLIETIQNLVGILNTPIARRKCGNDLNRDVIKEAKQVLLEYDKETVDKILESLPSVATSDKIKRVEVIDDNGRALVINSKYHTVKLSIQDNGTTLKVFICKDKMKD